MGLPLFQGSSEHKTKPKPKSKSRTSLAMAPASSSSSLEPHTGSPAAQNNNGYSSRRRGENSHRSTPSHRTSHRTPAYGTDNVNGDQDHYLPQVYEPAYNSAHTYAMYPPQQPVPVPPEASYHEDQLYYTSAQFHAYGSAPYDNEIRLEEEQAPAGLVDNQEYNSYPSGNQYGSNQYSQTPAPAYYRPQTPAQQYPMEQNISTSPTTAPWSGQPLADERTRLDLPRYPTEAEVEAARRAYEEASQRAPH